jgi:hypothetical protein
VFLLPVPHLPQCARPSESRHRRPRHRPCFSRLERRPRRLRIALGRFLLLRNASQRVPRWETRVRTLTLLPQRKQTGVLPRRATCPRRQHAPMETVCCFFDICPTTDQLPELLPSPFHSTQRRNKANQNQNANYVPIVSIFFGVPRSNI